MPHARSGPKPSTGRYETRQELVDACHYYYHYTYLTRKQIVQFVGVEIDTVIHILYREMPSTSVMFQGTWHQLRSKLDDHQYAQLVETLDPIRHLGESS